MTSFNSRKLLLLNPSPTAQPIPANLNGGETPFDANVVMVLSILLCGLICSFCLNFLVRCAFRCSSIIAAPPSPDLPISVGVNKKALKMFPTVVYTSPEKLAIPGLDAECIICLSEFVAGDKLRLLPKCSHGFHVKCIDTWLSSHTTCPKCRHNLIDTCHKILESPEISPATTPPPLQLVVDIQPLDHEGVLGCP